MSRELSREDILGCLSRLKYAKKRIKRGHLFICCQIQIYTDENDDLNKYLSSWISKMLDNYSSLEAYLSVHIYKTGGGFYLLHELRNDEVLKEKVKNTRINWINYMIQELKKEL